MQRTECVKERYWKNPEKASRNEKWREAGERKENYLKGLNNHTGTEI